MDNVLNFRRKHTHTHAYFFPVHSSTCLCTKRMLIYRKIYSFLVIERWPIGEWFTITERDNNFCACLSALD